MDNSLNQSQHSGIPQHQQADDSEKYLHILRHHPPHRSVHANSFDLQLHLKDVHADFEQL